jgi:cytochrome c biogenesis protein CcdA
MRPFDSRSDSAPSALWLWGFWIYMGAAFAAFVLSTVVPAPADRVLRVVAGVLIFIAGLHQLRVAKYKRSTRGPYTIWGFDSFLVDRQTGWSAMIIGVVFIAGAVVGL